MADDEAKKAKQAEIDRKRAEVRRRMEEASKAKKAKKGFMTPERKKKLRLLLRKKAAEELKKEQERKAAERRRIIEERCGRPKNLDDANEAELQTSCIEFWDKLYDLEGARFDLERGFRLKEWEIADLNSQVNDLRGKFVKPTLKKVSKYENKFAKLQKKAAEFNFRNQLKVVKKKEFTLEEEDKEKKSIVDFKKGDEKKTGEAEDVNKEQAEGETPPAVEELSEHPLPEGGETVVEPMEGGEPKPAEGEEETPLDKPPEGDGEGEGQPPPEPEVEQPPSEPEPFEPIPYIEPEDTPALIEDMRQCIKLLRQESKELPPEQDQPAGETEAVATIDGETVPIPESEANPAQEKENPSAEPEGDAAPKQEGEPSPIEEAEATSELGAQPEPSPSNPPQEGVEENQETP